MIDAQPVMLHRRYVGAPGAQVHVLEGGERGGAPPLCCLHATAYSGRSFTPFLQVMASRRRVMALDTPGYGGSDRPPVRLEIEGYAEALDGALEAAGEPLADLLGYHTGALVAAEMARRNPDRIRRLILIGVPFFESAEQAEWRERLAGRMTLTDDLHQFEERWRYFITDRVAGLSLERGFDNFVDELRAYPFGWWAHEAAFSFDVAACFADVRQPALVLNPAGPLADASRRAAAALANATLTELPYLRSAIFDLAPMDLAERLDRFLGAVA